MIIEKKGKTMFEGFDGVTDKQVEALLLIVPGPIGKGLTYERAAEKLGINKSKLIKRIKNFKDNFPDAWENIESMQRVASRQRESLESPASLGDQDFSDDDIEDRF